MSNSCEKFLIDGENLLEGDVWISGAKNAAVALIPAMLLVDGVSVIENIPNISDVRILIEMIKKLGAIVNYTKEKTLTVDASKVKENVVSQEDAGRMRASYYLIGALLSRFGHAEVPLPGGCNFGKRPINLHLDGFRALGATIETRYDSDDPNKGVIIAKGRLKGTEIYLDTVSVGATINIMFAAVLAEGETTIRNAAREPHIVDTALFLNAMGANIHGAGTDTIRIKGVLELRGGIYTAIPDQIEAGTYMIAASAVGKNVTVRNIIPRHMDSLSSVLQKMGVSLVKGDDYISIARPKVLMPTDVRTMPHPGFPTDLQPQIVTLLSVANGNSTVTEGVWDNRFQYVDELIKLGAKISVNGNVAGIEGVSNLTATSVRATDLRAGAAMVIAGLMAHGTTEIGELRHIDRGYEEIEEKLAALGAKIRRISE